MRPPRKAAFCAASTSSPALGATLGLAIISCWLCTCTQPWTGGGPLGFVAAHRLDLFLPASPPSWTFLGPFEFLVSWESPDGRVEALAPAGSRIEALVPRGRAQAILAFPRQAGHLAAGGDSGLFPAGALYPASLAAYSYPGGAYRPPGLGAAALVLDWGGGYLATLAGELAASGRDPFLFDLPRLGREARARVADPWVLPPSEAARRLLAGTFRVDILREGTRWPISLPGPGPWAPESPFAAAPAQAPAPAPGTSEGGWLALLAPGTWAFEGMGERLLVSVSEEGEGVWVRRAGSSGVGSW